MMNPPVISNSGSLEDCHTNFFALTDLCGIRWKKFVFGEPTTEPLKDPILRSYARCLRENILCVWRRVSSKNVDTFQSGLYETRPPNSVSFPPLSLKTSKELWIFWYGEEPELNDLVVPELLKPNIETAEGSYENGISYECRSLLFKALHNLIERCLLSRGIMRLGKWFVQPCTRQNCSIENGYHHMSFSFGFFVHGESTVCTSIDLRNHPNVRRLTLDHVKEAALNSDFNQHPVILAPYGLAGTLTGKYYKSSDPITKKTLKEWSVFYPLLRKTEYHYPPVVEVIAGGVKMCYPAKYVLVTDIDDEEFSFDSIPKMYQQDDMNEIENENKITTPVGVENIIGERVWQECVVSSQILASNQQDDDNNATNEKEPYFEHPTGRTVCNCTIRKNPEKQSNCFSHQHGQLIADISTAITAMGTTSSPELSPLFQYPPSVSPPEYEMQAHPIPSPNQLSSQYELQNFLNSSSDYDDTHSPFVLTAEQPQNNTLTPNPSPDSLTDKVQIDQISPGDLKPSGKSFSDDESREKLHQIKTEAGKHLQSSDLTALESTANALDMNIKSENLANEMDMDLDHNSMSGTNFLNTELANIFGDTGSNENETKMSFDSNDANKKSDGERKDEKNDSSDSDDEDDSDSDESDDSDDDDSSASENSDDASDADQKDHNSSKGSDDKSKKSNDDDGNNVKGLDSKDCDNDKMTSESLEKILSEGLPSNLLTESRELETDKNTLNDHDLSKGNDKLGRLSIENTDSNSDPFGLPQRGDGNKSDNLQCGSGMNADDNHSNISDSDVGDHMDDSSNDSAKSSGSFMARLTGRKDDQLTKGDATDGGSTKTDLKNKSNELSYSRNFLDDLATSDSSDSNCSEKDTKSRFSKGLDLSSGHDGHSKTAPSPDSKLKSLDSAIGSKSVEDDNAMSDLHTDNISDDEYDIKPDSIVARKNENFSVGTVRNSENFESIANYISPAPSTLNAIISADYSNLSDNNDTNSNDNNREDGKRTESSPNSNKTEDQHEGGGGGERNMSKNVMQTDLLQKTLMDIQGAKIQGETVSIIDDNKTGSINKSPFRADNKKDTKDIIDIPKVDVLLSAETVCKSDNFGLEESTASKSEFSSVDLKSDGSSMDGKGVEDGQQGDSLHKPDDDVDFSLNFFDEHSQCGILETLIHDPSKDKDDNDMVPLLPTLSTGLNPTVDHDSLSNIIDSIKSPITTDIERKRNTSPNNTTNPIPSNPIDEKFTKNLPPYISPAREHLNVGHCIENTSATDKNDDSNLVKSGDNSNPFDESNLGKDNLTTIDMNKRRPADMTRELELKIENPTEFLPEQITQSIKTEEIEAMSSSGPNNDKKSSSTSKNSGGTGSGGGSGSGNNETSKKSTESNKTKKSSDCDGNAGKSSSSSSKSSSKSSKKSKHSKIESSSSSSSKKSSKTSSKSDKSKSNESENVKNNENSSANQSSSSKKSKETSSHKRILKPSKRPHRTLYSSTTMQTIKRSTYNLEALAALMKTPNLGIRHHDIIAECGESPQMLYDFSTWEAWMNHPVKRFKIGENYSSRAIFKELQELYSKQNVNFADLKNHPPNSVESKSISDGLHTSDEDGDQDYYNDSESNSNLSDYDLNSPDILCSPTNFSDIYFEGNRNLSLVADLGGTVAEPDSSDNSNEGSMQDWTYNLSSSASTSASRLLISSKYAPLTNITPAQTYLQHNFIYRPSWESSRNSLGKSANRKSKGAGNVGNKSGLSSSKNKSKSKHKNTTSAADKEKPKSSKYPDHSDVKRELDFEGKSSVKCYGSASSKHRHTNMTIKEEPLSDTEVRNESDSDSDSETDKKKSGKKSDKSGSKKLNKNRKSTELGRRSDKGAMKHEHPEGADDSSPYDNNANSDENSNDSGQSMNIAAANVYGQNPNAIKMENDEMLHQSKGNIKSELSENTGHREDGDGQTTNLDKSSSSVEEYDNEKPSKMVTVNINLEYDSEVYNDEINIRKFHKYQKNIEANNVSGNFQVTQFETTTTETYSFETNTGGPLMETCFSGVNSDSDSDDSDAGNDLDDTDSSCDECGVGPCSSSILPPLQYDGSGSSPTSVSSYYNKNFNYLENIAQPVQRLPETNALILNLLLYDTSLNVFRDHNFDSCSLCVCGTANDGTFGNIRGIDSGRYLPINGHSFSHAMNEAVINLNPIGQFETESDRNKRARNAHLMGYIDTDPVHCSCGYSAITNRRLSHKSGLFYDDENEITGMAEDPQELKLREKQTLLLKSGSNSLEDFVFGMEKICGTFSQVIMDYIQEQCTCVQNSANSVQRSIRFANNSIYYNIEDSFLNVVEFCDAQDIIRVALNNSKYESQSKTRKNNQVAKSNGGACTNVHKWPYIKAGIPPNNKDVLKFMQMLMPVLQGSFNKKYMTRMWEAPYAIQGPLTWRQFHRLASTQSGQCEPQPIPSIVVGHEKEWLSVSPFAIQYWDQLMLEPYSYTRDVAYIVVAPDNDYIVDEAKQFFKELSTMYEMCKLGRHCPIKGCDGVLRSGKNTTDIVNDEFEELYALFEDNKTIEIIKSYVQTCQQHLVPYLTNISSDKSILDPEPEGFNIKDFCYRDKSMSSPMFQPDTPEFSYGGGENKEQNSSFESECDSNASYNNAQTPTPAAPVSNEPIVLTNQNEDEIPPCIIIYVLNPLSFGHESDDLQRLSCIALLRSYSKILNSVPDSIRNNIKLQIISMESILEMGQNCDLLRASDEMRCLALSIFSQCRRNLTHDVTAKILTGFGTAANLQMVIKNKDCNNRTPYKLYAPPYILSGREETIESSEVFGASTVDTPSSVLYCNYCLSEDQKWLLAVATDERGELLETITINIEVSNLEQNPNNRSDSVRRQSLQKLMDFIVGIISQTSQQWRIVIGRIGRIGHGELKAWSWLLCKSSLVKISKQLKDVCDQCSMMYLHSCPSIVSTCLLTLEPDTSFRILSDQFTPDERFSQIAMQSTLSTPSDLSCTHILVLPINAAAQAAQTYPEHHITDFSEEELFVSLGNSAQGMGGINGLSSINNMNSINGMNNMNSLNGMNSMNGMNVMNGIGGLNNISGMNMGGGNALNNLNGMNGLNALNNINNLAGVNNINGLGDVNSINGLNSINGIDGMDGIEGIDPMEGMDPIDAIDAMEAMDGMNNIEDFFGNDWENEIQIPNENPHDDSALEVKMDPNSNPNDGSQQLLEPKNELGQDMKQDHDQKPNANLMLSVNMSGLGHQVKLESGCDTGNMQMQLHNTSDEFGQMMQQPLAIGFMVSTAPINRMPPWFWANCPQLENVNPVFLKSSLHIHSPLIHQNSNEYINQRFSHAGIHPLDSPYTADTMRYILESYNFLSWLAIDPNTNDRISCLPAHIQVLIQLYNMIAAFT